MGFISRLEWLPVATSTNDVVAGWLREGTPEVCVAIADEQLAGRGRAGRSWIAPRGAALLLSAGFRPAWLAPEHAWRLAALVSLAMAEAAEDVTGLEAGTIRLKWPNDLVAEVDGLGVAKLAGVLGESEGLGTADPSVVVGVGVNAGWHRADFPPELADGMTSLAELAPSVPLGAAPATRPGPDRRALADAFLLRLEVLVADLRARRFPAEAWRARQLTNGRPVRLERPDGSSETVVAVDVDPSSGALLVRDPAAGEGLRAILVGEIRHLRVLASQAVAGRV